MKNRLLELTEKKQLRKDLPNFKSGDNVKVHVRIKEGAKERIQIFEGLVIRRKGSGSSETFSVRKISYGIGVERTFFVHSPSIYQVEIIRSNKVRRANLYYMRKRSGKSARLKQIYRKSK